MDLRTYEWRGKTWQFEAGEQPDGAVEVKPKAEAKAAEQPANKARKSPAKKAATADA
jgi:hypothetical protein